MKQTTFLFGTTVILSVVLAAMILLTCTPSASLSPGDFAALDPAGKAKALSGLDQRRAMDLVAGWMGGQRFIFPPNEQLVFQKDGRIEVNTIGGAASQAAWQYADGRLNLTRGAGVPFPLAASESYDKVTAELVNSAPPSLSLVFTDSARPGNACTLIQDLAP